MTFVVRINIKIMLPCEFFLLSFILILSYLTIDVMGYQSSTYPSLRDQLIYNQKSSTILNTRISYILSSSFTNIIQRKTITEINRHSLPKTRIKMTINSDIISQRSGTTTSASASTSASTSTSASASTSDSIVGKTTTTTTTISSLSSSSSNAVLLLHPWESWYFNTLEIRYKQSLTIKCPFFKRRAADILDAADMIIRFLIIRHKSILLPPPSSWSERSIDNTFSSTTTKVTYLSIDTIVNILKHDWRIDTNKGYYVTGRLTTNIFRDDCYFDGPDPDMPVRGLRKYLNAASQLFEHKSSSAELLSITTVQTIQNENNYNNNNTPGGVPSSTSTMIVAKWKISGVLRLPWKPKVPELFGETTYYLDESNLIYKHIEKWDVSAFDAFLQTFWPEMANRIRVI